MSTYQEKLSILAELIAFAKVDDVISEPEHQFLSSIAYSLNVKEVDFKSLFTNKVAHIIPKSQAARILQFHRLVLLMNVDEEQQLAEVNKLHNIGLHLGLPPSAVEQVLIVMHNYPDKIVPPDVLIDIFKTHYN